MIRAILWKEWREHRWKYLAYWLVLNCPLLLVSLVVGLSPAARTPFADLADGTVLKYLEVALWAESWILVTLFLFPSGFLAVATFVPELEDKSFFFVYELPVGRLRYVALKVLIGGVHVVLAVTFALMFAPAVAYLLMLASGKVTVAGSLGTLGAVLTAAARGAVWCSLISLAAFTACAVVATLIPRWWLATGACVLLIAGLLFTGIDTFDFSQAMFDEAENATLSVGIGSPQWVAISKALPLRGYGQFRAIPMLSTAALAMAMAAVTSLLYVRKELK